MNPAETTIQETKTPYLEMNHVRKSFDSLEVLKDISLRVYRSFRFR